MSSMPTLHGKPYVELSNNEIEAAGIRAQWEAWFNEWFWRDEPMTTADVEPGTDWIRNPAL